MSTLQSLSYKNLGIQSKKDVRNNVQSLLQTVTEEKWIPIENEHASTVYEVLYCTVSLWLDRR